MQTPRESWVALGGIQEAGSGSGGVQWDVQELRFPPPGLPAVRNHAKVSHFRICKSPGGSLYIQKGHPFPDMEELLAFYTENWKVIQSPLLQPCSPTVRTGSCRCHPPPFPDFFSPFGRAGYIWWFFFCWQVSGRCELFSYFLPREFPGWEERKGKRKGKGKGKGKRKRKKEEEKENEKIKRKRRKGKEKGKIEILSIWDSSSIKLKL